MQSKNNLSTALSTTSTLFKMKHRQSHFSPAFLFLEKKNRLALEKLYAVCRVVDDAVDNRDENAAEHLQAWKSLFINNNHLGLMKFGDHDLAVDFSKVIDDYNIPRSILVDLIDKGVAVDLDHSRFQTPMDLEGYCYGVAGTVGIACLPIFGVPVAEAKEFAIRLGIAIQWINIIRDVGVDAAMGRIYLPLDHLGQFGYTESDVFDRKNSAEFQQLMAYEANIARSHYKRAMELMPPQWKKELLPARIMGRIYLQLLEKIERLSFPVYEKKVRLNFFEKFSATVSARKE